ncbi:MAG: hypothetical protein OEV44_06280 [Spirochaetota bacterium]|nr:hypothetical protein [Spirochaetota bacterium]
MTYLTTEEYANSKDIDVSTVGKWAAQGKTKSVSVAHPLRAHPTIEI